MGVNKKSQITLAEVPFCFLILSLILSLLVVSSVEFVNVSSHYESFFHSFVKEKWVRDKLINEDISSASVSEDYTEMKSFLERVVGRSGISISDGSSVKTLFNCSSDRNVTDQKYFFERVVALGDEDSFSPVIVILEVCL